MRLSDGAYQPGSYFQDTPLIHPGKLDCGIRAADGLDNSCQIDTMQKMINFFGFTGRA